MTQIGPKGPKEALKRPNTIETKIKKPLHKYEQPNNGNKGPTKTLSQFKTAGTNEPKMTTKHPQTARKGVTFNLENNTTLEYTHYKAKKQKTRKRGKINKKKEGENLKILYTNANGILGKIRSLQVVANLTNSHVITLTETKSTPPNLEGYAPWITKNRKGKTGGGVAIATRQDIANNTQVVDDLEDHDQDILWIQINKSKHKKMFIGVYYGKQEDEAIEVVEREFSQLRMQLTKLKARGPIVLTDDFNAKIKIMKN